MRILHVAPFYEPCWAMGGMARAASELARALARRGHDVSVVTALLDPAQPREERLGGVRVVRFAGPAPLARLLFPWPRGLAGFLDAEPRPDVAHLHGHRNGFAAVAAPWLAAHAVPYVLQPCGTYPHHGQRRWAKAAFDRLRGRAIAAGAAAHVAVSDAEARDLPFRARVIANGVRAPALEAPVRRAPNRVLFVASDAPQKRGLRLKELLRALPEVELRLVGRFAPRFRRAFAPFGARASFVGVVPAPEIGAEYAAAGLVVHPAVGEAFGLVPFEAALLGTPAVVAGGHGCGEWFSCAGGCVVPGDDDGALAAAVRARLERLELGQREARRVAEFARRELTWERAAEAVEKLYAELTSARARGAA